MKEIYNRHFVSSIRALQKCIRKYIIKEENEWDAPLHLQDMFGEIDERIRKCLPDYHVNLIAPYSIKDFDKFETELGEVLEAIKYSNNKQEFDTLINNNSVFKELSNESLNAINLFTGSEIPLNKEKEVIDVCKAIEDLKKEYADERDITNVKSLFENGGSLQLAIATFKSLGEEVITGIYEEYYKTKNI